MHRFWLVFVAVVILSSTTFGDEPDRDLLRVLRDNGTITEEQYQRLAAQRTDDGIENRVDEGNHNRVVTEVPVTFSLTDGGLSAKTTDGRFAFRIRGRVHWQYAHYEEATSQLGDGTELRRARLELHSTIQKHWHAVVQFALDGGRSSLKTAALRYDGLGSTSRPLDIIVGQFKEPFSISRQSSTNYLPTIERSYVAALTPSRAIGVAVTTRRDRWTATLGVFGESATSDAAAEGDEGYSVASRVTVVPVHDDRNVVHFGLSGAQRWLNGDRTLQVSSTAETGVADLEFLDTGTLAQTHSVGRVGAEAALRLGSVLIVAEWVGLHATRPRRGNRDPFFYGHSVEATWIVTGEVRRYRRDKGVFVGLAPKSDCGGLELVARHSRLDLNDDGIRGGSAESVTVGVNWYANKNVRVMTSYTFVDHDKHADASGATVGRQSPQIFEARVQLNF